VRCQGGLDSFGRRKRSIESNDTETGAAEFRSQQVHFSIPLPSSASSVKEEGAVTTSLSAANVSSSPMESYNIFQFSNMARSNHPQTPKRETLMESSAGSWALNSSLKQTFQTSFHFILLSMSCLQVKGNLFLLSSFQLYSISFVTIWIVIARNELFNTPFPL